MLRPTPIIQLFLAPKTIEAKSAYIKYFLQVLASSASTGYITHSYENIAHSAIGNIP